ncbi:Adenylosuccinate synthetase, partial [Frankliniella fusca]
GAVHYAEAGHNVIYITASEFDSLPPPLLGLAKPTPDVFALIKFLYLPSWQDLLQYLFHLHVHTLIPTVLIVEALEHFFTSPDRDESRGEASHAALICASLLDGVAVCAKRSKSQAHLVVSLNEQKTHSMFSPLIDIFFTDMVWLFQKDKDSEGNSSNYCMINLETSLSQTKQHKIFYKCQTEDGAVVLTKVSFWEKL